MKAELLITSDDLDYSFRPIYFLEDSVIGFFLPDKEEGIEDCVNLITTCDIFTVKSTKELREFLAIKLEL